MTKLGRCDGDPLLVDLRDVAIDDAAALWDELTARCALPTWFCRNLDAWWDTIQTGAISELFDDHNGLIVLVASQGLFAPGNEYGAAFLDLTNRSEFAEARVTP